MTRLRRSVPWWLRIGAKIILSRLPVGYGFWKSIGLFEHGDMNNPGEAFETFVMHASTAGLIDDSLIPRLVLRNGNCTVLELGPGDSLFSGVIAHSLGATRSWLVDTGAFATRDPDAYVQLATYLNGKGFQCLYKGGDIGDLLAESGTTYLTEGIHSLTQIPSDTVDYCFSNAVLEHVPKYEFYELLSQLRRVMKPSGISVHRVDLKDHLGGGLNNLRFTEHTWEGKLFRESGFYTNRIRFTTMLNLFREMGFNCVTPRIDQWSTLPISRAELALPFRDLPDEELRVRGFDIVCSRLNQV